MEHQPEGLTEANTPLTLEEIQQLNGLRGVHPNKLFGMDVEGTKYEDLPPHVRSYDVVGLAIAGEPLDFWGRYGAHYHSRRAPFQNFNQITDGLESEEKAKFLAILHQYIKDIDIVSGMMANDGQPMTQNLPNGMIDATKSIGMETLASAREWVSMLIATANEPAATPQTATSPTAEESPTPTVTQSSFRERFTKLLQDLLADFK